MNEEKHGLEPFRCSVGAEVGEGFGGHSAIVIGGLFGNHIGNDRLLL